MNFIKCEKLEKSMAELQFSIDAEAFKKAVADVFKKEGKKYAVPHGDVVADALQVPHQRCAHLVAADYKNVHGITSL